MGGFAQTLRGLQRLNLLLVPKERAARLSYKYAQRWEAEADEGVVKFVIGLSSNVKIGVSLFIAIRLVV